MKMLSKFLLTNAITKLQLRSLTGPCAIIQKSHHVIDGIYASGNPMINKREDYVVKLVSKYEPKLMNHIVNNNVNAKSKNEHSSNNDKNSNIENLRKLRDYLEESLPFFFDDFFFVKYNHPKFYERGVIFTVEKNINDSLTTKGFTLCFLRLSIYRFYYIMRYKARRLIIKGIEICENESYVDVTFGIRCFDGECEELDCPPDVLEREGIWYNYRLVIHLSNKPAITKILLTQLSKPDQTKNVSKSRLLRYADYLSNLRRDPAPNRGVVNSNSFKI